MVKSQAWPTSTCIHRNCARKRAADPRLQRQRRIRDGEAAAVSAAGSMKAAIVLGNPALLQAGWGRSQSSRTTPVMPPACVCRRFL